MKRQKAFTLIELLIVVAIIAILAAIAVPNFLEAQVRAKVSRVQSDLRSQATGIEAYYVDHNRYPRIYHTSWYNDPQVNGQSVAGIMFPGRELNDGTVQHGLSTPIAYVTTAWFFDPFVNQASAINVDEQVFTYQDHKAYQETFPGSDFWPAAIEFYGGWRAGSIGPDRSFGHGFARSAQLVYDATNGTVSDGNIWRSQKRSSSEQPTDKTLLPDH